MLLAYRSLPPFLRARSLPLLALAPRVFRQRAASSPPVLYRTEDGEEDGDDSGVEDGDDSVASAERHAAGREAGPRGCQRLSLRRAPMLTLRKIPLLIWRRRSSCRIFLVCGAR